MAHYDVTAGTDTVSQAQFTEIYNSINKVFGDLYPGAVSTSLEANCATYRFGWGNRNSKQHSSKITHLDWNQLIARLNIILTHTGYTLTAGGNSVTLVTRGETIKATHYNAIADGINEILTNTVSINAGKAYTRPYYNYVSATQAELFNFTTTTREDAWQNAITTEIKLSFSDFDDVRYWHNSGADIRITPSTSGASSAAGITWAGIITKIGTYYWTIDGGNYTGTGGTIYDIGFCNLTTDYKLSFVSLS